MENSRCLLSFPKDCQKLKLWKLCLYTNPFAMPNLSLSLKFKVWKLVLGETVLQ
jgi:hypothetical protein